MLREEKIMSMLMPPGDTALLYPVISRIMSMLMPPGDTALLFPVTSSCRYLISASFKYFYNFFNKS